MAAAAQSLPCTRTEDTTRVCTERGTRTPADDAFCFLFISRLHVSRANALKSFGSFCRASESHQQSGHRCSTHTTKHPLVPRHGQGNGTRSALPRPNCSPNSSSRGKLSYQEEDFDQAAVHLLHPGFPPGPFPLGFDELPVLEQHHGPVGVGCDVLLHEIAARHVLDVLPGLFHCSEREEEEREASNYFFKEIPDGFLRESNQAAILSGRIFGGTATLTHPQRTLSADNKPLFPPKSYGKFPRCSSGGDTGPVPSLLAKGLCTTRVSGRGGHSRGLQTGYSSHSLT